MKGVPVLAVKHKILVFVSNAKAGCLPTGRQARFFWFLFGRYQKETFPNGIAIYQRTLFL
jgi:hypothetical protein